MTITKGTLFYIINCAIHIAIAVGFWYGLTFSVLVGIVYFTIDIIMLIMSIIYMYALTSDKIELTPDLRDSLNDTGIDDIDDIDDVHNSPSHWIDRCLYASTSAVLLASGHPIIVVAYWIVYFYNMRLTFVLNKRLKIQS